MAKMYELTQEDLSEIELVLEFVESLVAERGTDYYDHPFNKDGNDDLDIGCWYLDNDGACRCLVGHILREFGWTDEEINLVEGSTPKSGIEPHTELYYIAPKAPELWARKFRQSTLYILATMQGVQDSGMPWHIALLKARREFTEAKENGQIRRERSR